MMVDFKSTPLEPLALQARVVQIPLSDVPRELLKSFGIRLSYSQTWSRVVDGYPVRKAGRLVQCGDAGHAKGGTD